MKIIIGLLLLVGACLHADLLPFQTRPARVEDLNVLYELVCDLAAFEGKDLATLPVTKANLEKYGFGFGSGLASISASRAFKISKLCCRDF